MHQYNANCDAMGTSPVIWRNTKHVAAGCHFTSSANKNNYIELMKTFCIW